MTNPTLLRELITDDRIYKQCASEIKFSAQAWDDDLEDDGDDVEVQKIIELVDDQDMNFDLYENADKEMNLFCKGIEKKTNDLKNDIALNNSEAVAAVEEDANNARNAQEMAEEILKVTDKKRFREEKRTWMTQNLKQSDGRRDLPKTALRYPKDTVATDSQLLQFQQEPTMMFNGIRAKRRNPMEELMIRGNTDARTLALFKSLDPGQAQIMRTHNDVLLKAMNEEYGGDTEIIDPSLKHNLNPATGSSGIQLQNMSKKMNDPKVEKADQHPIQVNNTTHFINNSTTINNTVNNNPFSHRRQSLCG